MPKRGRETTTRRTYVFCLHHDEPFNDSVHGRYQQSHAEGPRAQGGKWLVIYREIQGRPPSVFRTFSGRPQRNRTREAHQGLAAHQENCPHRVNESFLERFEQGLVRASSISAPECLKARHGCPASSPNQATLPASSSSSVLSSLAAKHLPREWPRPRDVRMDPE